MSKAAPPVFSKGTADVDALSQRLNPLLTSNGGRWTLTNGGEALERTFKFKTFAKTWVSYSILFAVSRYRVKHCNQRTTNIALSTE
jgi:4a-hydroxytetrahydrobiopterin dehydratase